VQDLFHHLAEDLVLDSVGQLPGLECGMGVVYCRWLDNNQLTGYIPASFNALKNLTSL
jgi:hypothetical protein